jgi:hypothetical protein
MNYHIIAITGSAVAGGILAQSSDRAPLYCAVHKFCATDQSCSSREKCRCDESAIPIQNLNIIPELHAVEVAGVIVDF